MGMPRSAYYDAPSRKADEAEIVTIMMAIRDEFQAYGYRRMSVELRHRGLVVNSKKVRRLMREHDLQPKRRRRFPELLLTRIKFVFRAESSPSSDDGMAYSLAPIRPFSRMTVGKLTSTQLPRSSE